MQTASSGQEPALIEVCRTLRAFGLHHHHAAAVIWHIHGDAAAMPVKVAHDIAGLSKHAKDTHGAGGSQKEVMKEITKAATKEVAKKATNEGTKEAMPWTTGASNLSAGAPTLSALSAGAQTWSAGGLPLNFLTVLSKMLETPSARLQCEACMALESLASGRATLKLAICRAELVLVLVDLTQSQHEAVRMASLKVLRVLA